MMNIDQATQHIDHRCMQNIALQNVPDGVIFLMELRSTFPASNVIYPLTHITADVYTVFNLECLDLKGHVICFVDWQTMLGTVDSQASFPIDQPFTTCRLTHWGREEIDAISQTTFSNAFYWMKMYWFRLRFHWNLFPRVQLTISQHLVQIMAWRRPGDKPLSESMMIISLTHICVTRHQWVLNPLMNGPYQAKASIATEAKKQMSDLMAMNQGFIVNH